MKLNWKLKANGDEVAGPFKITTYPSCSGLYINGSMIGAVDTRAQAKRAAQRVADKILRNVGVKP